MRSSCRYCRLPDVTPWWITVVCAAVVVLSAPALGGENGNGVSPTTVSRPSGPGSLEGLGASFQPTLNTGTAKYSVTFDLPSGVAGFTPSLALQYDGGHGAGVAGIGWTFGPACVHRQVEKGLPRYGAAPDGESIEDRFVGMEGEQLVALQNGYYLARTEGLFIRYRFAGDHWEAHTKSGIKLEFGLTPSARITNADGSNTYAWCLERQSDTHGNVIEYTYVQPIAGDRQIYLSEVRYGPGGPPWGHSYGARMSYEDRPDAFTDCRPGFSVRTAKRLSRVDVLYDETLVRRYTLGYEADSDWSFLTTVTMIGNDGVSALPPTVFGYTLFDLGDGLAPISAAGHVLASEGEPPAGLGDANAGLIDLNSDGLPDVLETDSGHTAYLNRGVHDSGGGPALQWEGPTTLATAEARAATMQLSSQRVHLADMTGDGIADLVVADASDQVEYFENTGAVGWATGTLMSTQHTSPPAPFGSSSASVRTADLGFNKRIDILQSQFGALFSWYNQGDGRYTGPVVTDAPYDGSVPVDFSDAGVFLADMNGDRLADVAEITTSSVIWWANLGYARFGPRVEMFLPDRALTDGPDGNFRRARLQDVSGDGLSDLVVEQAQGADLWFWQNLGNGQWANSRVVTDLPVTPNATAHWADLNGNGTTDLVYSDATLSSSKIHVVDLGEVIGGAAHYNLLTSIDYGYGRKTAIEYRATTEYAVEAFFAGHAWSTDTPFPAWVVSRTRTSIGLDLDGYADPGPDGDEYVSEFVYRDAYYDPIEHQFRGFGFVKQRDLGDERFGGSDTSTMITRQAFHTGAPDGVDNDGDGEVDERGDLWIGSEEEPLKGTSLWMETTSMPDDPLRDGAPADDAVVFQRTASTWAVRTLCRSDGGLLVDELGDAGYRTADPYARQVRQAVQTQTDLEVVERGSGPAKLLRTFTEFDALGNATSEWNLGELAIAEDDLFTGYEYAFNESAWIMDRVSRSFQNAGDVSGPFIAETRNYYDGTALVGLPLGQMGAGGVLHRREALISRDAVPPLAQRVFAVGDPRTPNGSVNLLRQQVDAYGNPILVRDANGNDRLIEFDTAMHKYPVRETIVVGGGQSDLEVQATYDVSLGKMLTLTEMNGNVSHFTYDAFGRMVEEYLPSDGATPTSSYVYNLGNPISSITSISHDNVAGGPDVSSTTFFDGLGRKLGGYDAGGTVMSGVTLYDALGRPREVFQPYSGGDGTWSAPPGSFPATTQRYDAAGRTVETTDPPDDHAVRARTTRVYAPLQVSEYDGEDNTAGGAHENTPKTLKYDGLGRLIEVHDIEAISQADPGTFITRYRYAGPNWLAEIEDANGNVKYMRYDGLGRRIFLNDVDRGQVTFTFDDMGNVLSRVDALGQQTVYTYDGANRLSTEDFLDDGDPLSAERSPDVAYHYDGPHPDYPWLGNVKGSLGWVDDLTGSEILGYDQNGRPDTVIKRIDQPDGSTRDYMSVSRFDNLGRTVQTTYPDNDVVPFTYNARGLLETIPGFVDQFSYAASGQRSSSQLSNGVMTNYAYDARLRLNRLLTQSSGNDLQNLSYDYDQASNILGITDGRTLPPGDLRDQTAAFAMDDHYRLIQASGLNYGTILYDYDRLGNMTAKTSLDIPDNDVNVGAMTSGGAGGTSGRIGHGLGDPPGPHALTRTDNGVRVRSFDYDDNGNMVSNDGTGYTYDFADRLGRVSKDGKDIRYFYDYKDDRVIKRVDGVQTSYISELGEVRDGKLIKYVLADGNRIARVEGAGPAPASTEQVIGLVAGWNLFSIQVDPGSTDPQTVLSSIDGLYTAVFGHDGVDYTQDIPGDPGNTLTALLPNHGYWIEMTAPSQLIVEGPVSAMAVDVPANTPTLIGLPGLAGQTVADFVGQYPQVEEIWSYSKESGEWTSYSSAQPAFVNSLPEVESGEGYWIVSAAPITIAAPPAGGIHFYHTDHLGSTSVVTDDSGNVTAETYTYPFGLLRHRYDSGSNFDPYYQYTGKERDAESGLHYFGMRHYDAVLGRFITTDPLQTEDDASLMGGLMEPQRANVYAFAQNNPIEMVDPNGLAAKHTVKVVKGGVRYTIESTVYVYFDKDTDAYKSLVKGGSWNTKLAKDVEKELNKQFYNKVAKKSLHTWGSFNVKTKFVVVQDKPTLTAAEKKESTLLRIRRRTTEEKNKGAWGACPPGAGEECWFGEDPGGGAANANIWVDSSGNARVTGAGHFHEALHGMGLRHAVAKDKTGHLTPVGVPDIMGYGGGDQLTASYKTEYVRRILAARGYKNQTFYSSDAWTVGDITSESIQAAYNAANP